MITTNQIIVYKVKSVVETKFKNVNANYQLPFEFSCN